MTGLPGGASGKEYTESAGHAREVGLISEQGRSQGAGNGKWQHRQRSLAGYRPWDHKESDMIEQGRMEECTIMITL